VVEDLVVWIGTIAGILVLLSFIPQIIKAYKTKKMFDVSSYLMTLIAGGMFLWVVYGVIKSDPVIIGTNATGFALNVTLLVMKLKYDKLQSSTIKTSWIGNTFINTEIEYVPGLCMSYDIRTQLTNFAAEFMADEQVVQRLKEVFEKHVDTARVSREAGNYEQLIESYIRASAAATFLELIKKK
jgi:MtN3 and saliva related transmembrane protein